MPRDVLNAPRDTRIEKGRLIRFDEGNADQLAGGEGRIDERFAPVPLAHRLDRERGRRAGCLRSHELQHAREGTGKRVFPERLGDDLGLERGERRALEIEREVEIGHDGGDAPLKRAASRLSRRFSSCLPLS